MTSSQLKIILICSPDTFARQWQQLTVRSRLLISFLERSLFALPSRVGSMSLTSKSAPRSWGVLASAASAVSLIYVWDIPCDAYQCKILEVLELEITVKQQPGSGYTTAQLRQPKEQPHLFLEKLLKIGSDSEGLPPFICFADAGPDERVFSARASVCCADKKSIKFVSFWAESSIWSCIPAFWAGDMPIDRTLVWCCADWLGSQGTPGNLLATFARQPMLRYLHMLVASLWLLASGFLQILAKLKLADYCQMHIWHDGIQELLPIRGNDLSEYGEDWRYLQASWQSLKWPSTVLPAALPCPCLQRHSYTTFQMGSILRSHSWNSINVGKHGQHLRLEDDIIRYGVIRALAAAFIDHCKHIYCGRFS